MVRGVVDAPPAYQAAVANLPTIQNAVPAHPGAADTPEAVFELLITVTLPPKRVRVNNKKTKTAKPEVINIGPINVNETIEWDPFLEVIANHLKTKPENLRVSTFEWKWLKPASSPWLPLQNNGGLASLLKKVKTKADAYIILRTHAPEPDRTTVALPWNPTAGDASGVADEDERSDHEQGGAPKRVSIDSW